ncbi:MAG: MtrAB system histidine kinase MtrB [Frankiaceae bacterium]
MRPAPATRRTSSPSARRPPGAPAGLRGGLARTSAGLADRWYRSLQLRVIVSTLALSALVAALVGLVVMTQVRSGVLRTKQKAATAQTLAGLSTLQRQLDALQVNDRETVSSALISGLEANSTTGSKAGEFRILLLATGNAPRNSELSGDIDASTITPALRQAVARSTTQVWQYVRLVHDSDGRWEPGLAVGGRLFSPDGDPYQLYYVFPLSAEAQTISLVRRTLLFSGCGLVLLLVFVAWLVTRQVVRPVRQAAGTAEMLAAGRLQERMVVHGRDELATLASSFNRMAESLQRQIHELEDLSRLQRRFVSDVSHELRTPLTTVRMAADVLHAARHDYPPAIARSAELLQLELDRFESLLVDLLEISRYDARVVVLDAESTDLREIVRGVVDLSRGLADRTGCELLVAMPAEPVIAEVDPRRVERILRNLVSNALEHGEGMPVLVELAGDDHAVAIAVRDNGIGLRRGEATLVFNRFWRADPARARSSGGTGLGLSIALEDAKLHGGWLEAHGEPGRGSSFRLTLPRRSHEDLHASPLPLHPRDQAAGVRGG